MMRFVIYCLTVLSLVGCATTGGTQYKTNLKPYTIAGKTYYPLADAKNWRLGMDQNFMVKKLLVANDITKMQ